MSRIQLMFALQLLEQPRDQPRHVAGVGFVKIVLGTQVQRRTNDLLTKFLRPRLATAISCSRPSRRFVLVTSMFFSEKARASMHVGQQRRADRFRFRETQMVAVHNPIVGQW